ncbi:MAG: Asp-tRNA(Asn)/Glu-tRNA(Gln) amidotransferase subunit GatC [Candidatus Dormibacteria bacterium]
MAEATADPEAGAIAVAEVAHVSKLARLGLSPDELERLAQELGRIVAAVNKLAQADTSSVAATAQVGDLRNVTRADEVAPGLSAEAALANSGSSTAGLLRVPAIQ